MGKHVLVPVADGTEEIELSNLTDSLVRGGMRVTIAAVGTEKQVKCARGLHVVADALVKDLSASSFDAVLCPGGSPGAENLAKCPHLKNILLEMRDNKKLYGGICAAPVMVLGPHGLLEGVAEVTCYTGMDKKLPPNVKYVEKAVVKSGNCLTSRGPGTALFWAMAAISILNSPDAARKVSKELIIDHMPETEQAISLA